MAGWRGRGLGLAGQAAFTLLALALLVGIAVYALPSPSHEGRPPGLTAEVLPSPAPTRIGINLFGLATFNRQQVFSNLILQSEWFSSRGDGWTAFPSEQLDPQGWVRFLRPGQTAPRPLVLPPAPFHPVEIGCRFEGRGLIEAGGLARLRDRTAHGFMLDMAPTGAEEEGAWIELAETDPQDPVRNIDCRLSGRPAAERFSPEFLSFVRQFGIIRFLDWQRTNDNVLPRWETRASLQSATQVGPAGASIEDMVDLANRTGADPWFLMPYQADQAYIRQFARMVHDRLAPGRTVYVELGNEVWNSMFDAARQAQQEGMTLGLGDGDPMRAQMLRYAQKLRDAMRIWTDVFRDRPGRLVRVAASQNAWPDLATIVLDDEDTVRWIDALATAPYVWMELDGYGVGDVDRIFARAPAAVEATIADALTHKAIAARYGKRYLSYEGGQHFVTANLDLARTLQRDPRMGRLYRDYLAQWDSRIGGELLLYASTAPVADYGSWGLREYAGQPPGEAPKLRAVQQFLARRP
ncbi:hypothetical protein K7W03_00930 [Sphingobium sp. PNB]|uniref:hypothetical protein n=1 Tax=Sphingobium sp. PNB TaxID=863934 RepID=UPI001CA396E6|nr:hypothetical protein [Sphingobium sp. PNB]MCB4858149.1 hypothetical protein [Sphingobium sp. PNB]